MSEEKETNDGQPTPLNTISDETGQADPQFLLWRAFCGANDLDVNLLVSQLNDEQREMWNKTKRVLLKPETVK